MPNRIFLKKIMNKGLNFKCFCCKNSLKNPGALIFSPPFTHVFDTHCDVLKFHICQSCYEDIRLFMILKNHPLKKQIKKLKKN